MLEGLLEARGAGEREFGRAWRHAERRARACGVQRPRDYVSVTEDPDWLPFSSFFRRACRREWDGEVYADYLGLRELLEDSGLDGGRPVYGAERTVLLA